MMLHVMHDVMHVPHVVTDVMVSAREGFARQGDQEGQDCETNQEAGKHSYLRGDFAASPERLCGK
jgi:hypothetical protein